MKLEVGKTYTIVIPEQIAHLYINEDPIISPEQTKILTVQPKPKFVFVEGVEKEPLPEHLKGDSWYAVKYEGKERTYWFYLQDYYTISEVLEVESC